MLMIPCTIGITAHNEEANIGKLLQRILDQKLVTVEPREIIVVASGCTDNTEAIVRQFEQQDARVRLLSQEKREGKASAINLILRDLSEKVVVFCRGCVRRFCERRSSRRL